MKNVCGRHVAMSDAELVEVLEPGSDLSGHRGENVSFRGPLFEDVGIATVAQLLDNEHSLIEPRVRPLYGIDPDDIWMTLADERFHHGVLARRDYVGREDFYGDDLLRTASVSNLARIGISRIHDAEGA